jgi:hypothetical protein
MEGASLSKKVLMRLKLICCLGLGGVGLQLKGGHCVESWYSDRV